MEAKDLIGTSSRPATFLLAGTTREHLINVNISKDREAHRNQRLSQNKNSSIIYHKAITMTYKQVGSTAGSSSDHMLIALYRSKVASNLCCNGSAEAAKIFKKHKRYELEVESKKLRYQNLILHPTPRVEIAVY